MKRVGFVILACTALMLSASPAFAEVVESLSKVEQPLKQVQTGVAEAVVESTDVAVSYTVFVDRVDIAELIFIEYAEPSRVGTNTPLFTHKAFNTNSITAIAAHSEVGWQSSIQA